MFQNKPKHSVKERLKTIAAVVFTVLICILFVLCFLYRKQITAEQLIQFTPANQLAAVFFMLLIFALKSFCVFIYCGILYVASGIIFPIPIAILVNILGTVIMTSLPFFLGRNAGSKHMDKLVEKHPKLAFLQNMENKNSFFLSFAVRLVGIFPSDLVSTFFGTSDISYGKYLAGTLLGFLPLIIPFSVMGMSAHDVTSPAFLISTGLRLGFMIFSAVLYLLIRKKENRKKL